MSDLASGELDSALAPLSVKGAVWKSSDAAVTLSPAPWMIIASLPYDLHVAVLSSDGTAIGTAIVSLVEPQRAAGRNTVVWADLDKRAGSVKLSIRAGTPGVYVRLVWPALSVCRVFGRCAIWQES